MGFEEIDSQAGQPCQAHGFRFGRHPFCPTCARRAGRKTFPFNKRPWTIGRPGWTTLCNLASTCSPACVVFRAWNVVDEPKACLVKFTHRGAKCVRARRRQRGSEWMPGLSLLSSFYVFFFAALHIFFWLPVPALKLDGARLQVLYWMYKYGTGYYSTIVRGKYTMGISPNHSRPMINHASNYSALH